MTMLLKSRLVEDSDIQVVYAPRQQSIPGLVGLRGLSDNTGDQVRLLNSIGYQLEWDSAFDRMDRMAWLASAIGGDVFQVWKRLYFPQYHRIPSRDRFIIGRWIATRPLSFQIQLDPETIPLKPPNVETFTYLIDRQYEATDGLVAQSIDCGCSLLGSVAYAFGWTLALSKYEPAPLSTGSESEEMEWERMAQELIKGGLNLLHPIEKFQPWSRWQLPVAAIFPGDEDSMFFAEWSPLWTLFSGPFMTGYRHRAVEEDDIYGAHPSTKMMEIALYSVRRWLGLLQACGVDLEVYGTVEKLLMSEEQVSNDFEISLEYPIWWKYHCFDGRTGWLRVISLDIGPEPEDWRIWWAFEYEIWAQEFWEMVENTEPELATPGRWVD